MAPGPLTSLAQSQPTAVNGTMLVLGAGLISVATTLIAVDPPQYIVAAVLGVAGAVILYVRERLP